MAYDSHISALIKNNLEMRLCFSLAFGIEDLTHAATVFGMKHQMDCDRQKGDQEIL